MRGSSSKVYWKVINMKKKIRVSCIECPKCGDLIYSRAHHDYHSCSCGDIAIDGGLEYIRVAWKTARPTHHIRYVNATKNDLYQDWNNRENKFGIIKKLTQKRKSSKV